MNAGGGFFTCIFFSTMKKNWIIHEPPDEVRIKDLASAININEILASLLIQRGVNSYDEAKAYFRPSLEELHDPYLMHDMDVAVARIELALQENEKILVYGDYDVDGTTSVALVFDFLNAKSDNIGYYLPDRYKEGYGISEQGVNFAADNNYSLVISLDCGIRANKTVQLAKEKGIDFIICDHHLPGEDLPDALAILDPKKNNCNYPFKELSGCGLGFKLIQGLATKLQIPSGQIYPYLDLVAVSICADIVPIVDENRVMTYFGLRKLNQSPRPGLKALINISGRNAQLNVSDIVFGIAPRINAAGRMNHAKDAVQLLLKSSINEAEDGAELLNKMNRERKMIDSDITEQAIRQISEDVRLNEAKSTVLFQKSWHKGVIGIVASRVIEHYYRPTIILTESNGKATGSARSIKGFNIYEAIHSCENLLEQFGGHKYAAGLTLDLANIPEFVNKFEEVVSKNITDDILTPKLMVDHLINFKDISPVLFKIINQMEPFGPGNPSPLFASYNVTCKNARIVGEDHLKLFLKQDGSKETFDAIAFRLGEHLDEVMNNPFNIAFHIELNEFRGNQTLQLVIKDIKIPHVA